MDVTDFSVPRNAFGPEQFRVDVSKGVSGTLVVPRGELDLATLPELEAILERESGRLVVDLRELSFIDAAGLAVLLRADARSRQDGMNLSFVAGWAVRRLFECAGVPDPLTYVDPPAP